MSTVGEKPLARAIILSTDVGAQLRLQKLLDAIGSAGGRFEMVNTVEEATASVMVGDQAQPHGLFIDSRDSAVTLVADVVEEIPVLAPVVVCNRPDAAVAIEFFRAGALDVLDLGADDPTVVSVVLSRMSANYRVKRERRDQITKLREAMDEFLKDLVKTERRTIDLETQLEAHTGGRRARRTTSDISQRRAVVLIIEDERGVADLLVDRLEDMGLITFAFTSGEEAVANTRLLVGNSEPIDLALIDVTLPGIDGFESLRQLRTIIPGLPAMIMTGYSDVRTTIEAEDLGVADYITKPFEDLTAVLGRVREQALTSLSEGRERQYLGRIKKRHEGVLNRYREMATAFDALK